jgi:hypothetical protein
MAIGTLIPFHVIRFPPQWKFASDLPFRLRRETGSAGARNFS